MPLTYPPISPTISTDYVTIHTLLQSPALLARRLRDIALNRYIADVLLTGRFPVSGGAIQYQQGESQFTDRAPESVRPGMEYPKTGLGWGPWSIAEVTKWGQDVPITDESIKRLNIDPVNRALLKLVNQNVKTIDGVAIAAIASAVTATMAVTAIWTGSSAVILRDVLLAAAAIRALNQGFEADLAVVDDITYAYVASDPTLTGQWRRESGDTPVYSGRFVQIGGITFLPSAALNIPFGGTSAFVLDSSQLGGMADEQLGGPGYVGGGPEGIETKTIRDDDNDSYHVRCRRITVPIIIEPAAAIRITGVRA
jgi:hypothetical protein